MNPLFPFSSWVTFFPTDKWSAVPDLDPNKQIILDLEMLRALYSGDVHNSHVSGL